MLMGLWPPQDAGTTTALVLLAVPVLALLLDAWWGEPAARWHPVVYMGRALQWMTDRCAPTRRVHRDWPTFWRFALYWCALAAMVLIGFGYLQVQALALPWLLAMAVLAVLLKPLFAWRMLCQEVQAVERALSESLQAGRERLAWLVSRDVSALSARQVREAAIESLAENLNDSVVAPLFWFSVLGLPGAALYRLANTADAMWGYPGMRGGHDWQWAGKWAARADDGLSWVPARITALLLWLVVRPVPLAKLAGQARRTPSPNSGWPMASMALALGVRLGKPGVYTLNPRGRAPGPLDVRRALRLASQVVVLMVPAVWAIQLGGWLLLWQVMKVLA